MHVLCMQMLTAWQQSIKCQFFFYSRSLLVMSYDLIKGNLQRKIVVSVRIIHGKYQISQGYWIHLDTNYDCKNKLCVETENLIKFGPISENVLF